MRASSSWPLLALLSLLFSCSAEPRKCFIDFSVYDPQGERLGRFHVVSAKSVQDSPHQPSPEELLGAGGEPYRLHARGNRIYFDELRWFDWLDVTLRRPSGQEVRQTVSRTDCKQYESVFLGEQADGTHNYADWFERRGRLVGCALDQHWWIRSSSLFGVPPEPGPRLGSTSEGYLEPTTGEFEIRARHGVRHMIVVGKGPDPVKVFAANLIAGSPVADLGEFDLSGSCPATSD